MKPYLILMLCFTLSACAQRPVIYSANDFVNPNRVVTKTVRTTLPAPKVHATFGYGNNAEVLKAYKAFSKNGKAKTITSEGFITLPYDAYSHPIIRCAPLHLCVLQLERGERINNIELGDSLNWLVSTALVGTAKAGSLQIAIKPKQYDLATDMIVTTNRRTYNIGLVSQAGSHTHVTTFYYPESSLQQALATANTLQSSAIKNNAIIDRSTTLDVNRLNFHYRLRGDHPDWTPQQVFDDGNKTFIRLPNSAQHDDLPVLYLLRDHSRQLVNYRYQRPYYVIDGLFRKAILISGRGRHAVKVVVDRIREGR